MAYKMTNKEIKAKLREVSQQAQQKFVEEFFQEKNQENLLFWKQQKKIIKDQIKLNKNDKTKSSYIEWCNEEFQKIGFEIDKAKEKTKWKIDKIKKELNG